MCRGATGGGDPSLTGRTVPDVPGGVGREPAGASSRVAAVRSLRRIAALAGTVALVLPVPALAQGAGDEQYTDPLAGEDGRTPGTGSQTGSGSQGSGSGSSGGGGGGGGGQGGSPLSDVPPDLTEKQAANSRTPSGELARTGAEPGLIALLGAGFVLTGAGLRVRVRRPLA